MQSCYICEELSREGKATTGACMQCNRAGCKQQFHVTWSALHVATVCVIYWTVVIVICWTMVSISYWTIVMVNYC